MGNRIPAPSTGVPSDPVPCDASLPSAVELRSVMSVFPTSVVAIAGMNAETGKPTGLAVGTFTSISLDPPLAGFFVAKDSTSWPLIKSSGRFCANLLSHDQEKVARQFAARGVDKFAGIEWCRAPGGSPIIKDSMAWVDCVDITTTEVGDHLLVVGTIVACGTIDTGARVMCFHRSKMCGVTLVESLATATLPAVKS